MRPTQHESGECIAFGVDRERGMWRVELNRDRLGDGHRLAPRGRECVGYEACRVPDRDPVPPVRHPGYRHGGEDGEDGERDQQFQECDASALGASTVCRRGAWCELPIHCVSGGEGATSAVGPVS